MADTVPPNPNARRRNAVVPYRTLPQAGRKGRAPACPYRLSKAGREWWNWAWHTPQATAWDKGQLYVVARRARLEDNRDLTAQTECRHIEDRLGLTPKGMAALRWTIGKEEVTTEAPAPTPARRLRAVDSKAA